MKKSIGALLACSLFAGGTLSVHAADAEKKRPLSEAFDQMVIVAYGQNKFFDNGQKSDLGEDAGLVQQDGRVLVPIRMMGSLATRAGQYQGAWDVIWQAQAPNDVLLKNANLRKTVKMTVGSKTMLVNNEPRTMDTAPQKINGRIVLPLRSAAEALDKSIDWLDGLILIGNENVDLQSPQTLAVKDKIKAELTDARKRVDYDKTVYPLTKYGSAVYYYKQIYQGNSQTQALFRKEEGQPEAQVQLKGSPKLDAAKIIDRKLYYIAAVGGKTELDAFDLADRTTAKISAVDQWKPEDGWVSDIRSIDDELYVNLHTGDLTIGSESLYKAGQGALTKVASAKSFINYVKAGPYLYETDFSPANGGSDNLSRVDLMSGTAVPIGEPGFTYGVHRLVDDNGIGYGTSDSLFVADGYLYTLGYKDGDPQDASAVYRIDLAKGTQVKLTGPANDFWMDNGSIYYLESGTGYLRTARLDGSGSETLIERQAMHVLFSGGSMYYTVSTNVDNVSSQGDLYRYDIAKAREVKLNDRPVRSFYAGQNGVYYISDGYELGLYKIDEEGRNVRLVHDSIDAALLTDSGIVYTKVYQAGAFSVQ